MNIWQLAEMLVDEFTLESLVCVTLLAMGSAIAALWTTVNNLTKRLLTLSEEVGELRGKQQGITELGDRVIARVESLTHKPAHFS